MYKNIYLYNQWLIITSLNLVISIGIRYGYMHFDHMNIPVHVAHYDARNPAANYIYAQLH